MKYRVGDLTIDTGRQLVMRAVAAIALPKLSYDVLLALMRAAPNLVSLDELMRLVWPGIIVSPETVSQRVKLLRDALDDDPRAPRYIGGLRGRGYQIIAAVKEIDGGPAVTAIPGSTPTASAAGPVRVAICVLPFANMSGDPEQEYFSDGITEDIITDLSKVQGLGAGGNVPQQRLHIQGQARRRAEGRTRTQGHPCAGRQRAQGRWPRTDHGPVGGRLA